MAFAMEETRTIYSSWFRYAFTSFPLSFMYSKLKKHSVFSSTKYWYSDVFSVHQMRRKPLIRLHVKFSVLFIYYFYFSVLGTLVLVLLTVVDNFLFTTL